MAAKIAMLNGKRSDSKGTEVLNKRQKIKTIKGFCHR